jgi:protoheme IX farnesyltransferase
MIRTYYLLTKPGIIMGNLITTVSGFALASRGHIDGWLFLATLLGLGSVIASACVFNNYIDRDLDRKMARTKHRALVMGLISGRHAIYFAILLGIVGFFTLILYTNLLAVSVAAVGFIVYVGLYSFWKTRTSYATIIGSVSGAVPPVVGYCAVSGQFDMGAALMFMILVLWQMPHFYSIAMYRLTDYSEASVPVLPAERGNYVTKVHMLFYIIAFMAATLLLIGFGYTGYAYLVTAVVLGLAWLFLCIRGFKSADDKLWARNMFRLSLVIITLLCIMISIDTL